MLAAAAGNYFAVATNDAGSTSSNPAVLTVLPAPAAPTITSHPAGQSVNAGANATFSVVANGNPSPTYQWRKDGVNISGATDATLNLISVSAANAGAYSVVVTNNLGFVTSNPAILSLTSVPAITRQPVGQSVS